MGYRTLWIGSNHARRNDRAIDDKAATQLIDDMKAENAQVLTMTFGDQASGVIGQAIVVDGEVVAENGKAAEAATAAPAPADGAAKGA